MSTGDPDAIFQAGLNLGAVIPVVGSGGKQLIKHGDELLDVVTGAGRHYRPGAKYGSGSSMDAYRHELRTGELLSSTGHHTKLVQTRRSLVRILTQERGLSSSDRTILRDLILDIDDALR